MKHSHTPSCCAVTQDKKTFKFDPIFHGSLIILAATLTASLIGIKNTKLDIFTHAVLELLGQMWWGIALGLFFVGLMNKIPKDYYNTLLGKGDSLSGILRAAAAGLLFDLCSHGILMIGAKLYERGASLAQVFTFLIASPWNSFSMTLILWALIGWQWTVMFIGLSAVIAILTGLITAALTKSGKIPANPNTGQSDNIIDLKARIKSDLKTVTWDFKLAKEIITGGAHEAQILIKWLLFGIIIASCIRTFIDPANFADWFGPTLAGLALTLIATTLIEVCSEGSSPIAAELLNKAKAPGNAFTFLMAGVSTDYTEMMVLKDTTKSWKMALALPFITVPQILLIGYLINVFGSS
jgi:uncharacterized membrane protein YraQ (UPF0718 family)